MSGGDPTTVHATFVFADIAGFTAPTEAHGDQDAAARQASAIEREGDYFGAAVNLAARVSGEGLEAGGPQACTGAGFVRW